MEIKGSLGVACFCLSFVFSAPSKDANIEVPSFIKSPPAIVEFSNSSGAVLPCKTNQQGAKIQWFLKDGTIANDVKDLRRVDTEGNLIFQPFSAETFRQDVHSTIYKCTATTNFGIITTYDIQVKAVVLQTYDVHVYDIYAMQGNTAVMRCHIPSFLSAYINVTAWIKDSVIVIKATDLDQNSKYSLVPSGELLIKDVDINDAKTSFQCQTYNRLSKETVKSSTSGKLFVTDPQGNVPPKVLISLKRVIVKSGEQAYLPCEVQANPLAKISWQKLRNHEFVNVELGANQREFSGSLILPNVDQDDNGIYRCTSLNSVGYEHVNTELTVTEPLTVSMEFKSIIVDVRKPTSLSCRITGFPLEEVIWLKNGNVINFNSNLVLNKDNTSIQIPAVSSDDKGIYQCCAKNEIEIICGNAVLILGDAPPRILQGFDSSVKNPGDDMKLNCIAEGSPMPTISWLLDENILLSSNNIFIKEYINANGKVVSELSIESIKTELGGLYKCVAENSVGKEFHWSRINVYGPIGVRTQPSVNVISGQNAILNCPVYGYPLSPLKWEKDGIQLPNEIQQSLAANYSLIIQNVLRNRDGGRYTCLAKGIDEISLQGHAQLDILVAPKLSSFSFQEELVQEGSRGRLQCVVVEGDLPIKIQWQKDSKPLPSELKINIKDIDEFSSILTITSITPRHNGKYTCKATNAVGTASFSTYLAVNVPPKWILEPSSQTISNADNAIFHCNADGYPKPEITWMFAKDVWSTRQKLHVDAENKILSNGTLIIKEVSKDKEGRYTCIASNGVGFGLSTTVILSVLAPPSFDHKDKILNAKVGENVALICSPNGDMPITIDWYHNNEVIKTTTNRFKMYDDKNTANSTLSIVQITRKDSTKYICKAKNSFGMDSMTFLLNVQEPPEPPILDLNPKGGNRSILLTWSKSFDGNSKISNFVIQYKREVDSWQLKKFNQTVDGSRTSFNIINLQPATVYTFRITAVNAVGISKFSNEITQATDEDVPTGSVQNVDVEAVDGNTLRITWKAPRKETWNGAIRGYNIGYCIDGANEPYKFSALEVPDDYTEELIYQISKLKKYTKYTVVIQAYNDKGVGPLSEQTVVMTSEDVPSISPAGLRCSTLSSKSIYVLWDPLPADSANGILRGYKVLYKPVSEWYDSLVQFKTSEKERVTLQNLEVSTNYSVSILAFTKVGDGVKTNPVFCKTHEDVPDRPSEIKVLPSSSDSVVVAWKPPKRVNGDSVKYTVYCRPLSESEEKGSEPLLKTDSKTSDVFSYPSDREYFEVKGLRKNQKYAFWVSATSTIGEGQHSDVIAQNVADSTVAATSASFDDIIHTPWKRDITLPCHAVGVPTPQRKWSIGNSLIPIGDRRVLLSDGTLLINKVDNEDSGNYTCTIYNNYGKDEVHYSLSVQVPPSAPILDIVSKSKSSIQLKWKPGPNGGDSIKGYTLHYRKDNGEWEEIELSPDKEMYTLRSLACGANYHIFMEAFNKVGKGIKCDTIRTSTEGSEIIIPTKDQLLREGSTFVSVHLESWPTTSCPVESFQIEYKSLSSAAWTTFSNSVQPSQKKIVIPGLEPATWYALRVTAHANGDVVPTEYKFSTHTTTGATIPPPEIKMEKPEGPIHIFYIDPYIFIPAVALLIVVIIASVVIYMWVKRKDVNVDSPSDYVSGFDTWRGPGPASSSYAASAMYATIPHHKNDGHELNPYASGRVGDYFLDSDAWIESRTITRAIPHHSGIQRVRVLPQRVGGTMRRIPNRPNQCCQETTFAFINACNNSEGVGSNDGYDKPPKGM